MEHCKDQYLPLFNAVQNAVGEAIINGPASNIKIDNLHRKRLKCNALHGSLNRCLKTDRQFWANLAVEGFFCTNVGLCRSQESNWRQWSSARNSEKT